MKSATSPRTARTPPVPTGGRTRIQAPYGNRTDGPYTNGSIMVLGDCPYARTGLCWAGRPYAYGVYGRMGGRVRGWCTGVPYGPYGRMMYGGRPRTGSANRTGCTGRTDVRGHPRTGPVRTTSPVRGRTRPGVCHGSRAARAYGPYSTAGGVRVGMVVRVRADPYGRSGSCRTRTGEWRTPWPYGVRVVLGRPAVRTVRAGYGRGSAYGVYGPAWFGVRAYGAYGLRRTGWGRTGAYGVVRSLVVRLGAYGATRTAYGRTNKSAPLGWLFKVTPIY